MSGFLHFQVLKVIVRIFVFVRLGLTDVVTEICGGCPIKSKIWLTVSWFPYMFSNKEENVNEKEIACSAADCFD